MLIGPTVLLTGAQGQVSIIPPDTIIYHSAFRDKLSKETAHVKHFIDIFNKNNLASNITLIGPGGDPPDFTINKDGDHLGLELTEFTDSKRRETSKYFSKITDSILKYYNMGRLRGLSGLSFSIRFENKDNYPSKITEKDIGKLVSQLESTRDIKRTFNDKQQFPSGRIGSINWSVCSIAEYPHRGSKLANKTGFDVIYSYGKTYDYKMIQDILNNLIIRKDKNNTTNELLISASAPDQNGFQFTADSILLFQAFQKGEIISPKTKNIRKIYIDLWGLEKIIELI